jgi:aconitate hydratase
VNDSFQTRATLTVGARSYQIRKLRSVALEREARAGSLDRLPLSIRILIENLLRHEDGLAVTADDIRAALRWDPAAEPATEVAFTPSRVLLQDFTGVPAVVDLAAMRDAMARLGGDPNRINPGQPVELVIDHSVQVDEFGTASALAHNNEKEFQRNNERYLFLRWGQQAFDNFKVVPPGTGIVHQVNLEYLARVVMTREGTELEAFPDTLVGTDSHTTMINGLGVLGWGVGGIEAEAAMLGQPVSMLLPQVVGFRLRGRLAEGATATDLVLRVTEMLRKKGVVGKFVEFFGPGLEHLPLADRATIANMAPEYGATCGIFPVDDTTLDYMRFSGRPKEQVELVRAYMREQGLFRTADTPEAEYTDTLELDLSGVEPCLAGPRRPQDRVVLADVRASFEEMLGAHRQRSAGQAKKAAQAGSAAATAVVVAEPAGDEGVPVEFRGQRFDLKHGAVVIAAITSCTNTSNPSVMLAAGLVARKARERGLNVKPWVKTSLAPGSKVVSDYLAQSGLEKDLEALGFYTVGYGCTTCIGNSGPLPPEIEQAIDTGSLVAASVLSGNRNFEGRVHAKVRASYLGSPPLVVAYAIAGRVDFDPNTEALGAGSDGEPVFLRDVWPSLNEIQSTVRDSVRSEMFEARYSDVYTGGEDWRSLAVPDGATYAWNTGSTYVQEPPYFEGLEPDPAAFRDIEGARVLALLGDSVTTDHISPAGAIKADSPAGRYLMENGVEPVDFNSYGSRRGNHEVMMRGTFANVRLRNKLVPGVEGGETLHLPDGAPMSIFDAAMRYRGAGTASIIIAGKEYGTGSSRDWAAKGPYLLGVRAVIAASYERIHRSNLVGMGVIPLQFEDGEDAESLGLSGRETYAIDGLAGGLATGFAEGREVTVHATRDDGSKRSFGAVVRIDTPQEVLYVRNGGILQYVLRRMAGCA